MLNESIGEFLPHENVFTEIKRTFFVKSHFAWNPTF